MWYKAETESNKMPRFLAKGVGEMLLRNIGKLELQIRKLFFDGVQFFGCESYIQAFEILIMLVNLIYILYIG